MVASAPAQQSSSGLGNLLLVAKRPSGEPALVDAQDAQVEVLSSNGRLPRPAVSRCLLDCQVCQTPCTKHAGPLQAMPHFISFSILTRTTHFFPGFQSSTGSSQNTITSRTLYTQPRVTRASSTPDPFDLEVPPPLKWPTCRCLSTVMTGAAVVA